MIYNKNYYLFILSHFVSVCNRKDEEKIRIVKKMRKNAHASIKMTVIYLKICLKCAKMTLS